MGNMRVRQTILRAEYSACRIDFLLLLWAVIKIKNLFCASFYFLPTFFCDASLPPKEPWEPNLQHENSDAPSPSAGYNNHVALLGNRLAGEVDGKTIGCDDTGLFGRGEISIPPVPSDFRFEHERALKQAARRKKRKL